MTSEPAVDPAPVTRAPAFTAALLCVWAILTALALGFVPPLRFAWGYNFWQYLPPVVSPLLAACALGLCFAPVRAAILSAAGRLAAAGRSVPTRVALPGAFVLLTGALWTVREQQVLGDSFLLLSAIHHDYAYIFPELGATALGYGAYRLLHPLGLDVLQTSQLSACVFGAVTAIVLARAGARLSDGRAGAGPALAALVLSAGLLRVFAGHVEVYPALLMAASFYLWAALAHLDGRVPADVPALALGATIWVHVAALFLLPSLLVLPWVVAPGLGWAAGLRRATRAGAIAAVPGLLFLLWAGTLGPAPDFARLVAKILEVLGLSDAPTATSWWVRFGEGAPPPELGIDYVFLSFAHLKYLANAYHVLAPAAVAVVAATAALAPARLRDRKALFLAACALPLVVYSTLLRPFWGPFDWDLFSAAAFFLALWAARLVALLPSRRDFDHLVVALVGFQLLFVGGPFLAMAAGTPREAGPFVHGSFYSEINEKGDPPHGRIAPWL